MDVCPVCGYQDPLCWRGNRWVHNVSYCRIEDFVTIYPLFADIQPGKTQSDALCYYYRGKKQRLYVYRWSKLLGPTYYTRTRHLFERHVPRRPPIKGQTTLEVGAMAPILEVSH